MIFFPLKYPTDQHDIQTAEPIGEKLVGRERRVRICHLMDMMEDLVQIMRCLRQLRPPNHRYLVQDQGRDVFPYGYELLQRVLLSWYF